MSLTLVLDTNLPTLNGAIKDSAGNPVNLSAATQVLFQMWQDGDYDLTINGVCQVTNAAGGLVTYTLAANDLNRSGTFLAGFEVDYAGGVCQKTDPPVTITVRAI